jgi:hypothetical protein
LVYLSNALFVSNEEAEEEVKWAVMVSSKTALPTQALEHCVDKYTIIHPIYFV